MAKSFYGPFRITDSVDVEFGRDGDIFITFQDENGNVVGAILDPKAVQNLSDRLMTAVVSVSDREKDGCFQTRMSLRD